MVKCSPVSDLNERIQEWLRVGAALRAEVEREKSALAARLADADRLLAVLPAVAGAPSTSAAPVVLSVDWGRESAAASEPDELEALFPSTPSPPKALHVSQSDSLSDVVRKVLQAAERPMTARDIYDEISGFREISNDEIHRTLYRLKEEHEVEVQGERPARKYVWKGEPQQALSVAR